MPSMSIGQVAQRAGVGVETIRFYERRGLIDEPPRRASGYRQYAETAVARLRFIRRAKELGFSLREIGDLLDLRASSREQCGDVRRQLREKIDDVERRIADLEHMRRALREFATSCEEHAPAEDCPFLEALGRTGTAKSGDGDSA